MKLKVCGVRNQAMVLACQDELVDYIGFNFVPTSKRFLNTTTAQKLSHAFTGKKVGVFMNQSVEEIIEVLSVVDLDIVQLHGAESPTFIKDLLNHIPSTIHDKPLIWKAIAVDENFDPNLLQYYSTNCDKLLFDSKKPGTGSAISDTDSLEKAMKKALSLHLKFGIAGGLNPENTLLIKSRYPQADFLDTASGVETDGQFCREKLRTISRLMHHD